MSVVAEILVAEIRKQPLEDRGPIMKSILMSAGPEIESRVRQRSADLQRAGIDPKDALTEAFAAALHGPDGGKIINIMAGGAARVAAIMPQVPSDDPKTIAREYAHLIKRADQMSDRVDDGLGFVGTIIAAATAVISILTNVIGSAVRKARERRRTLAERLTPLNETEIEQVIQATMVRAGRPRPFTQAEPDILGLVAEMRHGRSGWLLEPTTGDNIGSVVNERADVLRAYNAQYQAIVEQIRQAQVQKKLIYAGATVLVAAGVTATVVYVTSPKKSEPKKLAK